MRDLRDKAENSVEVIYNDAAVKFLIGQDRYFVDDQENILDAAPFYFSGRWEGVSAFKIFS